MNKVIVIGAGPAGLMAAEVLAAAGADVHVFDAMPTAGRKFLLAGKGGLNLTHSDPSDVFATRYGARAGALAPLLASFGPVQLRAWAQGLGVETFVGTSGRVFPADLKAAPLLRGWLHRLRTAGVQFHMRHRWLGWADTPLDPSHDAPSHTVRFATPGGEVVVQGRAVVLALGGASWPQLGSDGGWVPLLEGKGVPVMPLLPSNCGFDVGLPAAALAHQADGEGGAPVETRRAFLQELLGQSPEPTLGWTPHFSSRFAGQPFKSVAIGFTNSQGQSFQRRGEFVATTRGVEGSLVYAVSALLRDEIAAHGSAIFTLDLLPDKTPERVLADVRHPRGARSLSSHLKSRLGLDGIKAAILYEVLGKEGMQDPDRLAAAIKALPIRVVAARPVAEAISTAGGVPFEALDANGMLVPLPGVWCAGEMLDWEAPTGGYLLTACFASGYAAGQGVARYVGAHNA